MSEIRFDDHDKIPCPYCRYSHKREAEDMPWSDDDSVEITCGDCGKNFDVRPNIRVSWIAEQKEE